MKSNKKVQNVRVKNWKGNIQNYLVHFQSECYDKGGIKCQERTVSEELINSSLDKIESMVERGCTDKEIASELGIGIPHLGNIKLKA